jgi:hypothetical protein
MKYLIALALVALFVQIPAQAQTPPWKVVKEGPLCLSLISSIEDKTWSGPGQAAAKETWFWWFNRCAAPVRVVWTSAPPKPGEQPTDCQDWQCSATVNAAQILHGSKQVDPGRFHIPRRMRETGNSWCECSGYYCSVSRPGPDGRCMVGCGRGPARTDGIPGCQNAY